QYALLSEADIMVLKRRDFLKQAMAVGALTGLPALNSLAGPENWKALFEQSMAENPWLLGWQTAIQEQFETPQLKVEGKLPEALKGVFYRNGPARHHRGNERYQHWFDGDGMIQSFRFDGKSVSHLGRFVNTQKLQAEQQAGKFIAYGFGSKPVNARPPTGPHSQNVANTSVLPHSDRLFALWEGGTAYALDPDTLDTVGPHSWSEELDGAPFSAHPKVDPNGTMWNFGIDSFNARLVIYKITAQGKLEKFEVVKLPHAPMLHDFVVTQKHLVFLLPPLAFDKTRIRTGTFLSSHVWRPELGTRVLAIAKDDLTQQQWYELPAGFQFHFGNAWEDKDGRIQCDVCLADNADNVFKDLSLIMQGKYVNSNATLCHLVTLDPKQKTAKLERFSDLESEFPRVDPRKVGQRNRYLFTLASDDYSTSPTFNYLIRRDMETGKEMRYQAGDNINLEEHIFIPKPGGTGEDEGWLMGTLLDWKAGVTRVQILDAAHIEGGPIATASLDYPLPLGFHGNFRAFV
ncbi:MAG: carotenoid oxygenase family protein, partial [Pseudomonadota bacterium]